MGYVQAKDKEGADEHKKNMDEFKDITWDRSCTDILCCLIFTAFIGTMVAITGYAVATGDPMKIIQPFDSVGNKCGAGIVGNNTEDLTLFPLKLFTNLETAPAFTMYDAVCVDACPGNDTATWDCYPNTDTSNSCPSIWWGTMQVGSYCVPDREAMEQLGQALYATMNQKMDFAKYIGDIQHCWQALAGMAGATILISIIYIYLLRWITKPLLYSSMVLILVGFILLGGWSYLQRQKYDPVLEEKNYQYATAGAIAGWVIAFIYACFMCCCWKNIALGASIMEAASAFVSSNLRVVLLPIFSYLISVIFFVYWCVTAMYLYSIGEVEFKENSFIANIKWEQQTNYLMWYFLFGLFWCVAFFICLQQFMIASMTVMWYFKGEDEGGGASVFKAMSWGMWYHVGSVSFGAFLIAVITMIRVVFEYLVKQYEAIGNKENPLVKAVFCAIRCVLYCLDKYVKFITKNAYIQIALQNSNFCKAAWDSFMLIIRQCGRFTSTTVVAWIIMMLGKGCIMGVSAYMTILIIERKYQQVQQPFVPAIIIAVVAYVVASLFLSIFSFSSTAILHCFIMCEDSNLKNVKAPESLKPFLELNDEQNSKRDKAEKERSEEKKSNEMD